MDRGPKKNKSNRKRVNEKRQNLQRIANIYGIPIGPNGKIEYP